MDQPSSSFRATPNGEWQTINGYSLEFAGPALFALTATDKKPKSPSMAPAF
jgi:hypothetical protein